MLIFATGVCAISQLIATTDSGKQVIIFPDHTWIEKNEAINSNSCNLRNEQNATQSEISTACSMLSQGWRYVMPKPKSKQASWNNHDRRTTWWYGYWYNYKTGAYSDITPKLHQNKLYLGDNQNNSGAWRNGGTPLLPDIFMSLLSKDEYVNY